MRRVPACLGLAAVALMAGCAPSPDRSPPPTYHVQAIAQPLATLPSPPPWNRPASDITRRLIQKAGLNYMAGGHTETPLHIHAYIRVWYDGQPVTVPPNLGIVDGRMAMMHTHDTTGTIHMEGPMGPHFTLGQFFTLWGVPMTGARVYQDGQLVRRPKKLELQDHTTLSIVFGRLPDNFGIEDGEDEGPQ